MTLICSAATDVEYESIKGKVMLVNDAIKLHKLYDRPIGVSFHWDHYLIQLASFDGQVCCLKPFVPIEYCGKLGQHTLGSDSVVCDYKYVPGVEEMFGASVSEQVSINRVSTMLNSGLFAFQLLRIAGVSEVDAVGCRGVKGHDKRLGGLRHPNSLETDGLNLDAAECLLKKGVQINWIENY